MEITVVALLRLSAIYLTVGLVFALAFATRGAAAVDPAARGGTWGFRALILPASAVLWPILALRWVRREQPAERNAHRLAANRRRDTSRSAPSGEPE